MEHTLQTIKPPEVNAISTCFEDGRIHSAYIFRTVHCSMVWGFTGDGVERRQWWGTRHGTELDKCSSCEQVLSLLALLTSWLSQPISYHYYTGDHFFSSILKCVLDVVIQTNKPVTIPQLNEIKRGTYFGRPPVILAKVSKKYAGIMWKMGADIR